MGLQQVYTAVEAFLVKGRKEITVRHRADLRPQRPREVTGPAGRARAQSLGPQRKGASGLQAQLWRPRTAWRSPRPRAFWLRESRLSHQKHGKTAVNSSLRPHGVNE